MEKTIAKRIHERLDIYYPKDKFRLQEINQVNTKTASYVYKIRIFDKNRGQRELYAKKHKEVQINGIHEIMGLNHFHKTLLIPRIIDYYEEENIILSECVKGDTLTKILIKSILWFDKLSLITCSKKIGHAIGTLQNETNRGTKLIGDLDILLMKEIYSQSYFKKILEKNLLKDIIAQVDMLKKMRTDMAQCHGDPSPHNILMKKHQVHLLDYSFQDNATFLDPSLYIVSLELMRHRIGLPLKNVLKRMENIFMEAYSQTTKETYEQPIWNTIKTLTYLHFLLMYSYRERNSPKTLVSAIDRKYLMKQIKEVWNACS